MVRGDPIVQEIREARARIFEECDMDLKKLINRLKSMEEKDKDRIVTMEDIRKKYPPKSPPKKN